MKIQIFKVMKDYFKTARILFFEVKNPYDRIILILYYLKTPIRFINYLRGSKNNAKLYRGIIIQNEYGTFHTANDFYSIIGFSSNSEEVLRKRLILDEGIAIDVGANGGMYSIPLGKRLLNKGQVIAIEPEEENFNLLKENIKINGLTNIIPIKKACFSKSGSIEFYLDEIGTGGNSTIKKRSKSIKVDAETLDKIIKDLKLNRIDLIKIDVEGAEAEVLKGAIKTLKKFHPKIIFEAWNEDFLEHIKEIILPLRYKIEKITNENYIAV